MLRSRMLSVAGVGCLGALLGTLGGVMIATYIAMGQFDSDLKQESARSGAALKTFEEEQEAVRKKSGKTQGLTETLAQGVGNAATAGLSPVVASTAFFLVKVIGGGALGLIGGTSIGVLVGTIRRVKRPGSRSGAIDDTPTHESGP